MANIPNIPNIPTSGDNDGLPIIPSTSTDTNLDNALMQSTEENQKLLDDIRRRDAEDRKRKEEERRRHQEMERKKELRKQFEAQAQARAEAEARAQAEAQAKAEAEARAQAEAQAKAKAEAEAMKAKAEAELAKAQAIRATAQLAQTQAVVQQPTKLHDRNRMTAAVLAFFLGILGAHKFYLGDIKLGILYLVFCWTYIPAILGIVDMVILLTMNDEKFDEKYNYK